jgi:hypothetical protein
MVNCFLECHQRVGGNFKSFLSRSILACACLVVLLCFCENESAHTLPLHEVRAIPAFARKYGLPCSACHTAWPELNNFGQTFRDNGYQLGNDRDSPIYQHPSYFPITFRITPNWHLERTNHQPIDAVSGDPTSGLIDGTVKAHGFDLSGIDIWAAGTLYKNISFSVLPSADSSGNFHFENAFVRLDNLLKSHWLSVKFGKFELDNVISEKRFLFLSANGGLYQTYHFTPVGDSNNFGLGDNQLGLELSGHSANSYTRYGAALLSSNDGNVGLPANRGYDTYLTFSQAFEAGRLGLERFGVYAYIGERPTFSLTSSAIPGAPTGGTTAIPGTGIGNKPFYRVGFAGDLNLGKFEFLPFFVHGRDNAFLGTSTPANQLLPVGASAPVWNGGFIETHYYVHPQFVVTQRYEIIRMSQQALATDPANQGDITAYSVGYRWYPIMFSRAGLAWHNEYAITKTIGNTPLSGDGVGLPPLLPTRAVWSGSLFFGFDFAF